MAYVLTVTVTPWSVPKNRIAPAPPAQPEGRVATVLVDLESLKWKVTANSSDFETRFKATSGTVKNDMDVDIYLLSGNTEVLYLKLFKTDLRASIKGIGFTDPHKSVNFAGVQKVYGWYCWYWRELAYSEMTASERMAEVITICCEKHLASAAKEEFGALASPQTIGIVVGVMLVFMATVGGWVAALRAFVGALLAGSGFYVDYQFYKDKHATISSFVNAKHLKPSQGPAAADQAAAAMAAIFTKILADFCMAKFGHALSRATGELRGLFTKRSAADWEAKARQAEQPAQQKTKTAASSEVESKVKAKQQAVAAAEKPGGPKAWMRRYFTEMRRGILGLNFGVKGVKKAKSGAECNLLEGEMAGYREISKAGNGNCLVLRDPGKNRVSKLKQGVMALSKDIEVVAKSFTATRLKNKKLGQYHGYVGVAKADIAGELIPAGTINLRQIDPNLPKGEFKLFRLNPKESDVKGMKSAQESRGKADGEGVRDLTKAEKKAVREKVGLKVLEDTYFCDIGEGRMIIVSRGTGLPTLSDVDMLAAAPVRNGMVCDPLDGLSLGGKSTGRKAGDDPELGRQLNGIMRRNCEDAGQTKMGFYTWFNHSERGGSAALIDKNGKPLWNPVENGSPPGERLIMFLKGETYIFDDWKSYKAFCSLNGLESMCPWDF